MTKACSDCRATMYAAESRVEAAREDHMDAGTALHETICLDDRARIDLAMRDFEAVQETMADALGGLAAAETDVEACWTGTCPRKVGK